MMINEKMESAFNDQINKEFYSEYLYLAMKAYFAELNLQGFVNWFDVQVQEEHAHGMGMYDYLLERGGKIELLQIEKPILEGKTPVELFEQVLRHEEFVTSRINALMDVAEETKDRAALSFLNWYLKEQVEEESNVGGVLATLKLIGDDKKALLMLDKDLSTRVFNAPVIG
jgi:ferritin